MPNPDYTIWYWDERKSFKSEYRSKECKDLEDFIWEKAEIFELELIRHTVNEPRLNNVWNIFGFGWFYLAKDDVQIRE